MAIANEQLKQIFNDLQSRFENDQYISIVPLGGDPPEKYEIHYNILGVVQEGDITESRDHSILISIPFGFPHFPPSCRPQTNTFHPDFDQAAICIGDFWNKDKSLSELIIYIGQMIAGEIYSTENAFNDQAVAWYKNNIDRLPFEELQFSTPLEEQELPAQALSDDSPDVLDDDAPPRSIDTLDESDITSGLDFLSTEEIEIEDEEISFPPTSQTKGNITLNKVHLLLRQKRYFEVGSFLATLPFDQHFDDMEGILANVETILNKAKKLQKEADEAEHQGQPEIALKLFEKIAELVPDFPNVNENIVRTRKTSELTEDWLTDDTGTTDSAPIIGEAPDDKQLKQKKGLTFFDDKRKATIRIVPILGVAVVIALIIVVIIPIMRVNSQLKEVEKRHSQCTNFMEENKFTQAQRSCENARSMLEELYFFKKNEQAALAEKIKQTIQSEKMQQGLAGKVFFQGKYIKKGDMETYLAFNKVKEQGDLFFRNLNWSEALAKYQSALEIAKPLQESFDENTLSAVFENNNIAYINVLLQRGQKLLTRGELERSKEAYEQANNLASTLPLEKGDGYLTQIKPKISEIEYLQHLDLGTKFFVSNDWEAAILQYEKALKLRSESLLSSSSDDIESLYANMAEAELYAMISSGKEAFAKLQWDNAIAQYQKAITLLDRKQKLLQRINPVDIQKQLQRIILRARIVQNKQVADNELTNGRYRKAITAFSSVVDVIISSGLQDEQEFSSIMAGTRASISKARASAGRQDKISYLVKNYKKIFQDNYSAAVPEYLSDPKATYLKNIGSKELYELQCLEKNKGRKLRLIMQYMYDPTTKKWQFYSEKS